MDERLAGTNFLCLENSDVGAVRRAVMKAVGFNPKGVWKELKRIAQNAGDNDLFGLADAARPEKMAA
ncbi:MAG: hypothetical protein LBF60_05370 [Treponema sp.]|jgi:hypothetical protein|nr:hypothetical protein [Treponema sp.]